MEARALAAESELAAERAAAAAERAAAVNKLDLLAERLAAAEGALARQIAAARLAAPLARVFAGVSAALRDGPETLVPSPAKMTPDTSIQASLSAPFDLGALPLSPA